MKFSKKTAIIIMSILFIAIGFPDLYFSNTTPENSTSKSDTMETDESVSNSTETSLVNCACDEVKIFCSDDFLAPLVCGFATMCSHNKPHCNLVMTESQCLELGISESIIPPANPASLSQDCTSYITDTAETPEKELKTAQNCCVLQHELVHIETPECAGETIRQCMEDTAYDAQQCCLDAVYSKYTTSYGESVMTKNLCTDFAYVAVSANVSKCICKAFESGSISSGSSSSHSIFTPILPSIDENVSDECQTKCVEAFSSIGIPSYCLSYFDSEEEMDQLCNEAIIGVGYSPNGSSSSAPAPSSSSTSSFQHSSNSSASTSSSSHNSSYNLSSNSSFSSEPESSSSSTSSFQHSSNSSVSTSSSSHNR